MSDKYEAVARNVASLCGMDEISYDNADDRDRARLVDCLRSQFPEPKPVEGVMELVKAIRDRDRYDELFTETDIEAESLTTAFINAREAGKWIPVTERLPKGECLVVGYQNEMLIGYVGVMISGECEAENDHEVLTKVTHWQPLPPAPKN